MDWQPIVIDGKSETFLISIVNQSNDNFQFNLTNLKELWTEKIEWLAILARAKDENPIMNVETEESTIERTIFLPAKVYQCNTTNTTDLVLKTKYYIGGVPFHFQWRLTKSNADTFYEEVTRKLLVTLLNVQDQRAELIDIIKRKDAEIAQYKIEGASLARKQVATQPFLKPEFDGQFELVSNSSLFAGENNASTIKKMCNYSDLIKKNTASAAVHVPEKPSPSKMFNRQKKREENAMRKFQSKKECKIQYESSFELLISDGEMEQDGNAESDVRKDDAIGDSMQRKEAPKRKLRSKLNL